MLRSKEVSYEWHDGVALIAQLIEQLRPIGSTAPPTTVPDLGSVALESTGWLTVSPEPERALPVMPGAAQLLQELLSGTDQPPQLRLYVMQVAGADQPISLWEFADELSKWERPNRIPKLVKLHARAVQTIGLDALTEEAKQRQKLQAKRLLERRSDDDGGDAGTKKRDRKTASTSASSSRSLLIGGALVLVAGLVAALEWRYVLGRSSRPEPASVDAPAPASVEGTTPTPGDIAPAPPTDAPARTTPVRRPGTRAAAGAPVDAAPEPVAPIEVAEAELERAQQLFNQQDYVNARAAFERILDSLRGTSSEQAETIRQTARNLEEVARAAVDAAIEAAQEYRAGDVGVTPPVPEAYLPPKPDPRTPPDKLQVMELRINADGNVDSAKFVINRPTYRNAWWPAAAKAWHFKPAVKNGKPVRYVMRIVMDDSDSGR